MTELATAVKSNIVMIFLLGIFLFSGSIERAGEWTAIREYDRGIAETQFFGVDEFSEPIRLDVHFPSGVVRTIKVEPKTRW